MKQSGKLCASIALLALTSGPPEALLPNRPAEVAAVGEYVNLAINGVWDFSSADAWAVGYACVSSCTGTGGIGEIDHMVILHWNGTAWSGVTAPRQGAAASYRLSAIGGTSATDIWAAGTKLGDGTASPLIVHFSGRTWSNASPARPATGELNGVAADAAGDAWAVGQGVPGRILTLHWDGSTWSQVPSPDPGRSSGALAAVAASTPDNAWAAGSTMKTAASPSRALALHWNGTAWSVASLPGSGNGDTRLNAVTVLNPRSAWAAGSSCPQAGCAPGTKIPAFILSWNQSAWSRASTPDLPAGSQLTGTAAISATSAWAVGARPSPDRTGTVTLILHWNGRSWSTVTSPRAGQSSSFAAVSAASATDAWAAGTACVNQCAVVGAAKTEIPLLAHWNGHTWSPR